MDNVLAVQSLGGNRKEKERFGDDSGESFKRYRGFVWVGVTVGQLVEIGYYMIVMGSVLYASTQEGQAGCAHRRRPRLHQRPAAGLRHALGTSMSSCRWGRSNASPLPAG